LRDAASTIGVEHDLQQSHHVRIIDSPCHLSQQPVVPDIVKGSGDTLPISAIIRIM
jgi:hypothetical protein